MARKNPDAYLKENGYIVVYTHNIILYIKANKLTVATCSNVN